VIGPSPTQLKLTDSTTIDSPSTSALINPGTPISTESVSSVVDSTKQSPLVELVNLPKIDYQNRIKTRKARVLTSNECLHALNEKEEKKRQAEKKEKEN